MPVHTNLPLIKNFSELTNVQFARKTVIDLLGRALTMGAAMWLVCMAGGFWRGVYRWQGVGQSE